ncbi:alpha-L-rhamnosidase C-terminal domain-containing protein, partial [Actinoallomurus acaciae]
MNSFNHYGLGSVGEWLYRGLAGLDQAPGSVAYREPVIRPRPFDGEPCRAEAAYESPRGRIAVRWRQDGDGFRLDVTVPPGATATVHVPGADDAAVREGEHPAGESPGVEFVGIETAATGGKTLVYRVESGDYRFFARRTG